MSYISTSVDSFEWSILITCRSYVNQITYYNIYMLLIISIDNIKEFLMFIS